MVASIGGHASLCVHIVFFDIKIGNMVTGTNLSVAQHYLLFACIVTYTKPLLIGPSWISAGHSHPIVVFEESGSLPPMRRFPPSPPRLYSIIEAPEHEYDLAEATCSYSADGTRESNKSIQMNVHAWKERGSRLVQNLVDRYCEICFKVAVIPCKTICCSKLFCLEHIYSWVYGPSSNRQRCPCCQASSLPGGSSISASLVASPSDDDTLTSKPDSPVILLVMQDSGSLNSEQLHSFPFPPKAISNRPTSALAKRQVPVDSCGPCFRTSFGMVEVIGRMIGRMLSVVGLTLFLFVLTGIAS